MATKQAKWIVLIGSILGSIVCVFGCANLADNLNTKDPSEKLPIRTLSIQIEENQREELFSQLRKFSEKYALEFHLSFYKGKEIFSVEMYGQELEILALSKPINTTELSISFLKKILQTRRHKRR